MIITTSRRRAVTLVEVLVAIFLMAIGLMAILSLFPLGAAQMAQALKDQRCAEAATNADAMARVIWKQACDADVNTGSQKFWDGTAGQRFVVAMDNPNSAEVPTANQVAGDTALAQTGASATGASYPVLVDPIGSFNPPSADRKWWMPAPVGTGLPNMRIPRRSLFVRTSATTWPDLATFGTQRIFKQFSLMDDISFNFNGTPNLDGNPTTTDTATATPIERQGRYTWSYMFRRPSNADRTTVDITTIIYSGRSIDVPSAETAYPGSGISVSAAVGTSLNPKQLTLNYTGLTKPAIRRGQWILDATLWDWNGSNVILAPQGYFYRVVNVDDSTANQLGVELQTPLLGGPSPTNASAPTFSRSIIVMNNVVEVFTRANVTAVSPPMPY
jgi:Tfp pilus assembly protein PilV